MKISTADCTQNESIASLINRAYRGKVGWTLEYHLVSGQRITTEEISTMIANRHTHLFVLTDKGHLLGTVCLEERKSGTHLGLFAVEPLRQNLGIGKKLLHFAENFAKDVLKSRSVKISVISIRKEILAYYQRRGYQIFKEDQPFPEAYVQYLKRKNIRMTLLEKII